MSFLFTNPFDDVVEKATSENNLVGHEDIVANLDIADKIRGKEVPPKQAIQALKRRINHKNPNVQMQALKLTDTCVKNSGQHFIVEVASRDFVDNLVSIVRNYPTTNQDVRLKILALLQTWGLAFKGKTELMYVTEIYETLKREGLAFPPVEKAEASSIMIDTKTTLPLPHLGITQEVRVCDSCHYKLTNKVPSTPGTPNAGRANSVRSPRTSSASPLNNEDEELQKAIAASLADAEKANKRKSKPPTHKTVTFADDEEDPDLKAAIEASLAELKLSEQKRKTPAPSSSSGGYNQQEVVPVANPNELSRVEIDNLKMFVELVERMEADVAHRGIGVMNNSQISTLYVQLMALQPKLFWSLDDSVAKYRSSLELNEKITAALQLYDRLLQERLNAASGGYASTLTRGYSVSETFPRANSGYNYGQPAPVSEPYPPNPAPNAWGGAGYPQQPQPYGNSFPPQATPLGAPVPQAGPNTYGTQGPTQAFAPGGSVAAPPQSFPDPNAAYSNQGPSSPNGTGSQSQAPQSGYAAQPGTYQPQSHPPLPQQQYTYSQQPGHTYFDDKQNQSAPPSSVPPQAGPAAAPFGGYAPGSAPPQQGYNNGYQQSQAPPPEAPQEALLIEF
ncbi:Vacuolar protein-sorting-associated protein 27 [Phlyctochytrium planicorne]|nr:Vacuolar protein-sorting-associated protein 27 [Phlyctochytrium planicorne]